LEQNYPNLIWSEAASRAAEYPATSMAFSVKEAGLVAEVDAHEVAAHCGRLETFKCSFGKLLTGRLNCPLTEKR